MALPVSAGAASKPKHRLQKFGSCSGFVHYARRRQYSADVKARRAPGQRRYGVFFKNGTGFNSIFLINCR